MNANSLQTHSTVSIALFPALTVGGSRFATQEDLAAVFEERRISTLQDLAEAAGGDADPDEEEWELGDDEEDGDEDENEWELGDDEEDEELEDTLG